VPARGSLHHLELYVPDLERSLEFWGWLLLELGYEPFQEWDEGCSFRSGGTYLVFALAPDESSGLDRRSAGLNHLAFHAASREDVDHLTDALRARGVRILYEDRHPHAGGPDHYAVFCEDPDGLQVELVAAGG
jgi:catechol 2,3-dioxygenase-like lactoylglutathione lyase family enzyme